MTGTALEIRDLSPNEYGYKVPAVLYEFDPILTISIHGMPVFQTKYVVFFWTGIRYEYYAAYKTGQVFCWNCLGGGKTIQEIVNDLKYCVVKV